MRWQEGLHPATIELGLERVLEVAERLESLGGLLAGPNNNGHQHQNQNGTPVVVVVAGTNGKGSSIAMLESIYRAAGYRTAAYTSPHLLRYNERLRLDGRELDDQHWCQAFEQVDAARSDAARGDVGGDVSLTYFEFGTLAALWLIAQQSPQVVLLEIGLGGRLDAVNIVDADVALITNIALDHQQWLGDNRDTIAAEKAGILRGGMPAVFGERDLPAAIARRARQLNVPLSWPGHGFDFSVSDVEPGGWYWQDADGGQRQLPLPALPGSQQIGNAAAVIEVIQQLHGRLPVGDDALRDGLRQVSLAGRMQHLDVGPGDQADLIVDVAHNPHATAALANNLAASQVAGKTRAILAVLDDKDLPGMLAPLLPIPPLPAIIDEWYCAGLPDSPRALPLKQLADTLEGLSEHLVVHRCADPQQALRMAQAASAAGDRIIAFGSFFTVAATVVERAHG